MTLFRNLLFWIALVVLGALVAQMLLTHDHGFVLVRYGGYDYTTTLVWAIGIGLLTVLVLWLLWQLLSFPFRSWGRHRDRQSRARLSDGLDALHQGHYQRAEKLLAQACEEPDAEAPARVAGAHAAWARGDRAAARQLLAGFGERHTASRAIAEAELALSDDRPTDALVALDAPAAQPLPPRGLALRAEALATSGQAAQAYEMLGALRQQQALPAARLDDYETLWAAAALREAADANALADRWEALSKSQRADATVVAAYADRGAALRWEEAATRSLEQALDARWDESLAERYGLLPLGRVDHRRQVAERWLQAHPSSPALLLTLARLANEQQQWAQAEDYLHRALAQGAGSEAWETLAHGYEARGDQARARLCYRNALRASRGEPIEAFADREPRQRLHDEAASEDGDAHGLPRLRE